MTEISFGDTQTYTLPLQSIDLTYLSKYVSKSRNEIMPLWSNKHLDGEHEYYEIKVKSQEFHETDCFLETLDTFTCHICDLEVPKIYVKEHNESEIHVKLKNIFEKVLERISKQINSNNINNERDIDKSVYYCEPCCKAIKLKNKYKHESSDLHSKSMEKFNILNNFHKMFCEIEIQKSSVDKKNSNENGFTDRENNNRYDKAQNNLEQNDINERHSGTLDSDDDYLSMISDSDDELNIKETSFESYLKEVIAKYNLNVNLPSTDGEFIDLVTPTGNRQKVSRQNFHSYKIICDRTYCQICKAWISKHTKAHDVMEIHVRNIFKPVSIDFYRKINDVSNHCLLCNEIFSALFDHANSETHKKKLKQDTKTMNNVNYNVIAKSGKTLCSYCNIYIDTHNFLGHTNSKKHQNKMESVFEQNKIAVLDTGEYICNFCNMLITEHTLITHINQNPHIKNKSEKNDVPMTEYCELCQVKVPKGGMEIHNEGNQHTIKLITKMCSELCNLKDTTEREVKDEIKPDLTKPSTSQNSTQLTNTTTPNSVNNKESKITGYYKLLVYSDSTKTNVTCTICNVRVPNNENNIRQHMEGRYHVDIVNKRAMGAYALFLEYTDNKKTEVKCRICDLNIPLVQLNISEHMNGMHHDSELKSLLNYHTISRHPVGHYQCVCCEKSFINFLDHIDSDEHTENYQNDYVIDRKLMRKYVYDDDSNHGFALRFRVLYKNLMRVNEIDKLDDVKFYCGICDIDLGRISEIDHMLGERHKARKEELEDSNSST